MEVPFSPLNDWMPQSAPRFPAQRLAVAAGAGAAASLRPRNVIYFAGRIESREEKTAMRRLAPSRIVTALLTGAALAVAVAAQAAETINYTYDARGRVIAVKRSGTVNNLVNTTYNLDKADNRLNKTTTGSPNGP
jgi:hypothetical protein